MKLEYQKKIINLSTILSVVANVLLTGVKLAAGILSGSVAMITDAVHSLSDLFTDVIVFFSLHWSLKSPDQKHPYGHGKIENIAAVIVGLLLLQLGLWFIYEGAQQLIKGEIHELKNNWALWAAVISIVVKEALFQVTKIFGKKIKSDALIANAWHHRSDAFSSVVALAGIGSGLIGFKYGDLIASVVIAGILIWIGVDIIRSNANILIEASVGDDVLDIATAILKDQKGVKRYRRLRLRQVGKDIYGEVNIEVKGKLSVKEGHDIAQALKKQLIAKIEGLKDISIHIDPVDS